MYFPPTDPDFRLAAQIDKRVDDLVSRPSVQLFAAAPESVRKQGSIYVVDGPPIVGLGSGTLFRVGQYYFIITAAHVVEELCDNGREFRVAVGNPSRPQPLPITDENSVLDEDNDVAAILLKPEAAPHFVSARFLGLDDIAFDDNIHDWWCVLHGCLWEGTQPGKDYSQLLVHNLKYWTKRYDGKVSAKSFDDARHILVEYERTGFSVPDSMPSENPKSLGGISGASLWRLFTRQHVEDGWSERAAKVVAVENVVYDERVIRCTRWRHVLPLLAKLRPEIETELNHLGV